MTTKRMQQFAFALFVILGPTRAAKAAVPPAVDSIKLLAPQGYLPQIPMLVRVEVLNPQGARDWNLWDGEALLSVDEPGVTLSTNRVPMRNGMGSALVAFDGGSKFTLSATVGSLQASRSLASLAGELIVPAGGTNVGDTVWSGVIQVTNSIFVPSNSSITMLPGTLVLIDGVTSGTNGISFFVNGHLDVRGTEDQPVTLTCSSTNLKARWGQMRFNRAALASAPTNFFRHTLIHRGGRTPGEGHTGQGPILRPQNSRLFFEHCSLTDHEENVPRGNAAYGTPGKIGFAVGADLTFIDCLFQRAREGPEIEGTALLITNSVIMDMLGPDDSDGVYIHAPGAGQSCAIRRTVIAAGDDDAIDTLDPVVTIEDCIIRDWNNLLEDAKGISVFNGATIVRRSLIVNCTVGIAAKSGGTTPSTTRVLVSLENCTLTGNLTNVYANRKSTAMGPVVHFNITNSVLWGGNPVHSDFEPGNTNSTNFTIVYSDVSEIQAGTGNLEEDPLFVEAAAHDFRLQPYSPAIDSGLPTAPRDSDGSRADMGWLTFLPPPPVLANLQLLGDGTAQFLLNAYTHRSYVVDFSETARDWMLLKYVEALTSSTVVKDPDATNSLHRFYRARLAP